MSIVRKVVDIFRKALVDFVQCGIVQKSMLGVMNILSRVIKKDPKIILCGAMNGHWYGDNSRYVYEWILENRPDLKPVWLTKNAEVYKRLAQQHKPVATIGSLRGLGCLLKAEKGLFTNSLHDLAILPFLIPDHIKLVALRHGRSVKRIRFARKSHKISRDETVERRRELVVHAISTSEFISDIQEECLQIGRHKHVVTGYPRNDLLWEVPEDEQNAWHQFIGDVDDKTVILYAPSWRHGRQATKFFPFDDFSVDDLARYLESRSVMLLLRPHANDLRKYPELVGFLRQLAQRTSNIRMATHVEFPDVNSLLPYVDILISDYSALYHDYLLLKRPMLFIPYDLEEFREENGFLYDYEALLPGPKVGSLDDFGKYIDQILAGKDQWNDKRQKLCDLVHSCQDKNARKRVVELLERIKYESL